MNLKAYKNIIIDLGGVILDIDYSRTTQAFQELGIPQFANYFTQANQSKFVEEFEKGTLSAEAFRHQIRIVTQSNLTDNEIDMAWDALILEPDPKKMEALKQLSRRHRLFLLSNNNAIHYEKCILTIEKIMDFSAFSALFNQCYYSHLIHLRKPDREAFDFVLNENQLKMNETIFFDDSLQHLQSAQSMGLSTQLINASITLEKIVETNNY